MGMNQIARTAYEQRLASGHSFLAFFGPITVSFSKISGLCNEMNVETIQEGGVNDAKVMLLGPRTKLGTVTYEHGIGTLNPLNRQFEAVNQFGVIFTFPTTILVFSNRILKRAVGYNGGVPVKWSLSALDAQTGSIVLDTVEVTHQGIFEVPI